jgi:glycosyltransferase involved in cell wall biosynthesis
MLAIVTTHPIQYQVPIWQELAHRNQVPFEVWYLSDHGVRESLDKEFGCIFRWDINMLADYPYRFLMPEGAPSDITTFRAACLPTPSLLFNGGAISALWINGWQVQAYWQAAAQAHLRGIPIWLRSETNNLHHTHLLKKLPRWLLLRWLFRRVKAFLCIGSANRRFYQRSEVALQRLHDAPYCVDNARFAAAVQTLEPQRNKLRQHWNIPESATCFLFSGKLISKKRPFDLIAALTQLIEETPTLGSEGRIHLLVVGDGELRAALVEQACELGHLAGRPIVTFVGFLNQSEIAQAYVAADCLVLPSDTGETWGLVVNEALACSRPAIVSDQCGCAEDLARPLGKGHVYRCGDVGELRQCLRVQIELAGVDRRQIYARLIAGYTIDRTVATVERLYAETVAGSSGSISTYVH